MKPCKTIANETIVRTKPKLGRNDKVMIKNLKNGEIKELKFKHAEKFLVDGEWLLLENNWLKFD